MLLETALKEFSTVFNETEGNFGIVQYRDAILIDEPIPLGDALKEYYSRLLLENKPAIGHKFHLRLITLNELIGAQSGWLWVTDKSGKTIKNDQWKSSWVIVADRNGDAIFVDTESPTGAIYGSIQQRNFLIAKDLGDFFYTIAECMIVERDKFGYEVMDDDFNVVEPFLVEVRRIAEKNLGVEGQLSFMKFFFE